METSGNPGGALKAWNVADLPAPPPFNFGNVVKIVGPGAIALSMSIGSGEWLIGPSAVVKYGPSLMWIVLVSVFFQVFLNQEFTRYTLYTGEPVLTGFMRTKPGGNIAGFIMAFSGIHILVVQHRLMPKEVRAPLWRQVIIVLTCIFFAFFVLMNILKLFKVG